MRIAGWVAVAGAVAVLLAGCGGGGRAEPAAQPTKPPPKLREVWVSLDGRAGAENVAILMAQERGYFEDVGLLVNVGAPVPPRHSVMYVANGTDDIAISQLPQVVLAREKGMRVRAVGSLLPRPTAAMIWLRKSGIHSIADLKGKTIATAGIPFQEKFLGAVLAKAGLSLGEVKVKDALYSLVPSLVSGRADAIFGGSWNLEGARLKARGLEPVIMPARRLGIPAYDEIVVVARVNRNPRFIRDFMSAVTRGTAAAVADPEGSVRAIENSYERDHDLSRKAVEAEVEATLPLLSTTGLLNPARAGRLVDWMHEQALITQQPATSELLTNRFLSPQP